MDHRRDFRHQQPQGHHQHPHDEEWVFYDSHPPSHYPLRTLAELRASSPSLAEGLTVEQEEAMLRTATNLIIGAGQSLHM